MRDIDKVNKIGIEKFYIRLKESLVKSGTNGICLDIDDTIAATNVFFAQKYYNLFDNPEELSPEEIIARYHYVKDVPYWQDSLKQQRIEEDFQLGEYVHLCPPISKAREAVFEIDKTIQIVAYLTGRPQRFYKSTCTWLDKHEFPKRRIIMEPEKSLLEKISINDRNEWKAKLLEFLFPEVIGTIDDNSDIVKSLSPNYGGLIFLYSNNMNYQNHPNVICCPDWENIKTEINKRFKRKMEGLNGS